MLLTIRMGSLQLAVPVVAAEGVAIPQMLSEINNGVVFLNKICTLFPLTPE